MEIQHFSHVHPLMLKEIEQKNKYSPLVFCSWCEDRVLGLSYNCNKCSDFTIHKSCAELPREMHHPSHREHPLILHTNRVYRCDACRSSSSGLLSYSCSQCNFDLDFKCVSNWRNIIESETHDHNFTVIRKPKGFTCDACGEPGDQTFYFCSICQLLVHKECTSLPRHIKITSHQHPIVLTWLLKASATRPQNQMCKLCNKAMGQNRADYCCQSCSYIAHFRCAIKNIEVQDETTTESAAQQIKHFSHQHVLSLTTHQNDDGTINICEACIGPITPKDAFYRCTEECHFFLHKTCAQLPTNRPPSVLHLHQLTLLLPSSSSIDTVFE